MQWPAISYLSAPQNRRGALGLAAAIAIVVATADYIITGPVSLGPLYLFPLLISAGFLASWQLLLSCIVFTFLRELLADARFAFQGWEAVMRLSMWFVGYMGMSFFTRQVVHNRQTAVRNLERLEEQVRLRRDAEEQLRVLVESSPAGILIVDTNGRILDCNQAVTGIFGADREALCGELIRKFVPLLASVPGGQTGHQPFRTKIETRGKRFNGDVFPAHIWLSTYETQSGNRMAAIVLDASEELREREEEGLHRLLSQSHIVAGAVWHEVRNLCAAISVVHLNLSRDGLWRESADFQALGNLVEGLKNLASVELRPKQDTMTEEVSLQDVLEDMRIVLGGQYADAGAKLVLQLDPNLPSVMADRYGLMQVFLNLAQNSLRAMNDAPERVLTVEGTREGDRVVLRFRDTGPGIADSRYLFQPFQRGAQVTGMGLYVSRAIVRDFLGELNYERQATGCCFSVSLVPATVLEEVRV